MESKGSNSEVCSEPWSWFFFTSFYNSVYFCLLLFPFWGTQNLLAPFWGTLPYIFQQRLCLRFGAVSVKERLTEEQRERIVHDAQKLIDSWLPLVVSWLGAVCCGGDMWWPWRDGYCLMFFDVSWWDHWLRMFTFVWTSLHITISHFVGDILRFGMQPLVSVQMRQYSNRAAAHRREIGFP